MRFWTKTGSEYEIRGNRVRRISEGEMRGDGDWLRLNQEPFVEVGHRAFMILEPLGDCDFTTRTTSPVVKIERGEDE